MRTRCEASINFIERHVVLTDRGVFVGIREKNKNQYVAYDVLFFFFF